MARDERFTFLCNAEERRVLSALAQHLQRTQSDAVRWLIVNAGRELNADQKKEAGGGARKEHVQYPSLAAD